ncbi:FecR family protein [Microbulbifer spongiae]|uniref:FecR domain-containing protein n=1 Tax=Microbulbifer spongiae TaxID=2944933 RepID=A0ABY9EHE8_9GAMM|nr:FecR domain-containing protein [Microbulbifer sp. MI-G]WKD51244.1 FecR domain-containing protein [Microbulbifer sp. MI-G]
MSNIYKLKTQQQCYDQASQWIAKLDKGLNAKEIQALHQWLASSGQNRQILFKMAEIWDKMDALSRLSELFPSSPKPERSAPRPYMAVAASILMVFAGLCTWVGTTLSERLGERQQTLDAVVDRMYETAIGEHSSVNLPDGSQLVLNTNSQVKVNYTDYYRLLVLERGEIHVKVAHDKSRPLSVIAGDKVIQAVGTAFNVEINSDQQIELVVTDGKVLVAVHKAPEKNTAELVPEILPPSSVAVSKGEQLVLGGEEEAIEKINPKEIQVKLSWREGNLVFRGEPLENAVAEISRYTQVEFVILDENLKKVRIAGLFKAGDVKGLLLTLRKNFDISYQRIGESKVLLSAQ